MQISLSHSLTPHSISHLSSHKKRGSTSNLCGKGVHDKFIGVLDLNGRRFVVGKAVRMRMHGSGRGFRLETGKLVGRKEN